MPVTVVDPESPADYGQDSFISVAELGSYLGRTLTSDAGAAIAVEAATDWCRTMSSQTFTAVSNDTVILDGTGTDALLLPQLPVTRVRSVKDEGVVVDDWTLTDQGVLIRQTDTNGASTWSYGRQRFTVAYDHGYQAIPDDIRMVALAAASRLLVQGPEIFESIGQSSVRYGTNSTDLTNGEKAILRKYRRAS